MSANQGPADAGSEPAWSYSIKRSPVDLLKVQGVLSDDERAEVARPFASHGYDGPLRVARARSEEQRVIVLPDGVLARLRDAHGLQEAVAGAIHRKVLIIGDSLAWSEDTEPLG